MSGAAPCPECGEKLGARYRAADGRKVCWPCLGLPPERRRTSNPAWVQFRLDVSGAMERDGACHYITEDRAAGWCPVCGAVLGVHFRGREPVADFICHGGCDERHVMAKLGKGGRRR